MKRLIIINKNPVISIERTNTRDIKVVHLCTGIHATYHSTGHNHFFDPKSTKVWKDEIKNLGGHGGELVSCTTSLPFDKIIDPEFFIGLSSKYSNWKEKYKKIESINLDLNGVISIYLSGKLLNDDYFIILDDEHPYVLIKKN
jgi:hypothetical protein